jgi:hypothetical protein
MIAKTFFLAKIIHRIGTQSIRQEKSLLENQAENRAFFVLRAARRAEFCITLMANTPWRQAQPAWVPGCRGVRGAFGCAARRRGGRRRSRRPGCVGQVCTHQRCFAQKSVMQERGQRRETGRTVIVTAPTSPAVRGLFRLKHHAARETSTIPIPPELFFTSQAGRGTSGGQPGSAGTWQSRGGWM